VHHAADVLDFLTGAVERAFNTFSQLTDATPGPREAEQSNHTLPFFI
jgi:hypothetical protein